MPKVGTITSCSTASVKGLSRQIIAEMNLIVPNVLVAFDSLSVTLASEAVTPRLQGAARDALKLALAERPGKTLTVNSAYRTVAQQYLLFRQFQDGRCNIPLAAKPGKSNHENGLALDVRDVNDWKAALEEHDWQWLGPSDPVHFTYSGPGVRHDIGALGIRAFQRLWNRHNPTDRIAEDGLYGPSTAARLAASPAEGFAAPRILFLTAPPMAGEDVRRVQLALKNNGLTLELSGTYSLETKEMVAQFQEDEGLLADGIVGPATRRALGLE